MRDKGNTHYVTVKCSGCGEYVQRINRRIDTKCFDCKRKRQKQANKNLSTDRDLTRQRLSNIVESMIPVLEEVIQRVSAETGVGVGDILGRCRSKDVFGARRKVYQELRVKGLSLPKIGELMDRDHSTICKVLQKVSAKTSPTGFFNQ